MALKIKQDDKGMVNRKKKKQDNKSKKFKNQGRIFHKEETVERKWD